MTRRVNQWSPAILIGIALLLSSFGNLAAQRSPGGFPFREGGRVGGDRGRDPTPPVSAVGPGAGPADFLRRLDGNGDGVIDLRESQGRTRFILERLAAEIPQLDLSRPIQIDRLAEALTRLREQRMRQGGRADDRGPSRDWGGSASSPVGEPLVPGFGFEEVLPPPPGFGKEGELFSIRVIDEDHRQAEERFRRYDTNRDGFLERVETARGRWSDDPFTYDRNQDGRLTPAEMAVRYARRRLRQSESSREGGSTDSPSPPSSTPGGPPAIFSRSAQSRAARTREEIVARARSRFSAAREDVSVGKRNLAPRGHSGEGSGRDGSQTGQETRKSYRFLTPKERLPKGLPEWFLQRDSNADGQVAMAEFSTTWSDSIVADFTKFDLNGDGFIIPKECVAAAANGVVRGSTVAASPAVAMTTSAADDKSPAAAPSRAVSRPAAPSDPMDRPAAPSIDFRFQRFYGGLVDKYDDNRDGVLTANEWTGMSRDPSAADVDANGQITVDELAAWATKR